MSRKLLLVEDDLHISSALISILETRGYQVAHAATFKEALAAETPDLVLLDLSLPDGDGLDLCAQLRQDSQVPIIAVTARGTQQDRVAGLRGGADDYVVKPFSIDELEARIEAVLRRADPETHAPEPDVSSLADGRIVVEIRSRRLTVDGSKVELTRKEFDLLTYLIKHRDKAVSRAEILDAVWHTTWEGNSRTVDVHIGVLRQKLGDASLITTVRGVGYRLEEG